jgi:hypothetical protein
MMTVRWRLICQRAGVVDAEIVLGVLVEILGGDSATGRRRPHARGDVALEALMRGAADANAGAAAAEGLSALGPLCCRDGRFAWKGLARPLLAPWRRTGKSTRIVGREEWPDRSVLMQALFARGLVAGTNSTIPMPRRA